MGSGNKRKHASFEISSKDKSGDIPAIVLNFPGSLPPNEYQLYAKKTGETSSILSDGDHDRSNNYEVKIDSERLEFDGSISSQNRKKPVKYVIGIVDHNSQKISLSQAKMIEMNHSIKALKSSIADSNLETRISNTQKRDLGTTFGTSKAIKAIRSYDRGQIDLNSLSSVKSHIQSSIDDKAKDLDTPEQIEELTNLNRTIPPFDPKTEVVENVYKIDDIITPSEMLVIPISNYMSMDESSELDTIYQMGFPDFISERLVTSIEQDNSSRAKMLIYLNYMLLFRSLSENALNNEEVRVKQLGAIPAPIESRLMDLFTELHPGKKDGSTRRKMPQFKKDKLVSYICALCLHIDSFNCNPGNLAKDLKLTATKLLDFFKQLGCKIESKSRINSEKYARLIAPVQFPKAPRPRQ